MQVGTGMALSGLAWGPMLRQLAGIYAVVAGFGSLLLKANPAPPLPATALPVAPEPLDEECEVDDVNAGTSPIAISPPEACDPPGADFMQAITSKRFALLWLLGLTAFTPGLTVLGLYKRFGMTSGGLVADDRFLSAMGGLGAIANGAGRVS